MGTTVASLDTFVQTVQMKWYGRRLLGQEDDEGLLRRRHRCAKVAVLTNHLRREVRHVYYDDWNKLGKAGVCDTRRRPSRHYGCAQNIATGANGAVFYAPAALRCGHGGLDLTPLSAPIAN